IVAVPVAAHEITGTEPQIPWPEDVAQDLLLARRLVDIAVIALRRLLRIELDARYQLADRPVGCPHAAPVRSTHRRLALHVEVDHRHGEDRPHPGWTAADRAGRSIEIEHHR